MEGNHRIFKDESNSEYIHRSKKVGEFKIYQYLKEESILKGKKWLIWDLSRYNKNKLR